MNQGWLASWGEMTPPPLPPLKKKRKEKEDDPLIEIESPRPLKKDKKITAKTLHRKISVTAINVGKEETSPQRRKSVRLKKK